MNERNLQSEKWHTLYIYSKFHWTFEYIFIVLFNRFNFSAILIELEITQIILESNIYNLYISLSKCS